MNKEEQLFRRFLEEKNLKRTPERLAVLREVLASDGHFDADQLFEMVQKYNKRVSRATVYRVLPLLVESGFVAETLSSKGRASYERVYGSHHHDHMICEECQEVIEFRSKQLDDIIDEICRFYGFVKQGHRFSIRGLCPKCTEKTQHDE